MLHQLSVLFGEDAPLGATSWPPIGLGIAIYTANTKDQM